MICKHCGKSFEAEVALSSQRVKNEFGFVDNTKGSFISELLKNNPLTKDQIMQQCFERFADFSAGRTVMVLGELRKRGYLKQSGNTYWTEIAVAEAA